MYLEVMIRLRSNKMSEYKYTCPKCGNIWMSTKPADHKCPKCGFGATKKENRI